MSLNITKPTNIEKLYQSSIVIYLRHNQEKPHNLIFDLAKDRYGSYGIKELPEAIDSVSRLLSQYKFQGSNVMFQETLSLKLSEVMKDVLINDDCIPSSKTIKEYIEGD